MKKLIGPSHFPELIFLTLIISVGFDNIRAQQFEWISSDFPDSRFLGVFEIEGKYIGAVSNGPTNAYDPNTIYQLTLYDLQFDKHGGSGLILNEITSIPFPENYATIELEYIEETELWILVQSAVIAEHTHRYRVILCDENFNILAEQSLDTIGHPSAIYIDSYKGMTYVLGSIIGPTIELFFLQYSHSDPHYLPSIEVKQSEPNTMFSLTSMNIDHRTGDILTFYYNGVAALDSNLHQVLRLNYDNIRTAFHGYVIGTETHYFTHGLAFQEVGNWYKFIVFHKYDTLFNTLAADTLGIRGEDHYPFFIKSLDHRDNQFLMGAHLDGPFAHSAFPKNIKKFYLAKFDEEMNRLWYKEYGGDRAYIFMGLKLLEAGDGLAYGFVIDTLTDLWFAYIMHVDENGEILTSQVLPSNLEVSIKVVNPGDETLRILNPEGIHALIELYDMQGYQVLNNKLNSGISEIYLGGLAAGVYPYKVIQDGLVITSGKWVKEK